MTEEQKKKQFEKDKTQAIEEGYTEDQAIQYATQEQQLRNNQQKKQEAEKKSKAVKKPKKDGHQKDVALVGDSA